MDQAEAEGGLSAARDAALAACASLTLLLAVPAFAEPAVPVIRVSGEASESFLPDKAILSLGVVTEQPRASDAANQNSKAVQGVIDAIKRAGIEARAIQSASVSLEPIFRDVKDKAQTIVGFRASNQLEVEVTPPEKAGLLAGALIDQGVNSIDDIRFASNANEERADRLRGLAMRDARHKAEVYVAALGLKLGRVIAIDPQSVSMALPAPMRNMARTKAAPVAVPLEAGQQSETSSVAVTWEIAP